MSNSIAQQLERLRLESGVATGPDSDPASLGERISRLRRKAGAPLAADQSLGGRWCDDGVLLMESEWDLDWDGNAGWSELVDAGDDPRWTFIDTETTGLSGGVGTSVFLFGVGRIGKGRLKLRQFLLARPGAEAAFWREIEAVLGDEPVLVSYNGKAFDWPLVVARQRLCRRSARAPAQHLDLLHWVRRAFGDRWADCRLTTCEARLLGCRRENDLPGSQAPDAYREFLCAGRVDRLRRIVQHHRLDVLNLARLLPLVAQVYRQPGAFDANAVAIARWWMKRGEPERARGILERDGSPAARRELGHVHRRQGRWTAARAVWEELAQSDDPVALEALAKYHEHRKRAPRRAINYCRRLVELRPTECRHRHRLARLMRKIE